MTPDYTVLLVAVTSNIEEQFGSSKQRRAAGQGRRDMCLRSRGHNFMAQFDPKGIVGLYAKRVVTASTESE